MNLQQPNIKNIIEQFIRTQGYVYNHSDLVALISNIYTLTKIKKPTEWHEVFCSANYKHVIYKFFKQYENDMPIIHFIVSDHLDKDMVSHINDVYNANEFYTKMNNACIGDGKINDIFELFDVDFINYISNLNISENLLCKYNVFTKKVATYFLFEKRKVTIVYYDISNSLVLLENSLHVISISNISDVLRSYKLHSISQTSFNTSENSIE